VGAGKWAASVADAMKRERTLISKVCNLGEGIGKRVCQS
jgi:hypothetical protein